MFQGLRTVVYKVDDIALAREWYVKMLGIEPYFDEPFYVGFTVGGYELGLDPDMSGVTRGNGHVAYWGVSNCEDACSTMVERGAEPHEEPKDVGGGIIVASVRDPFGNIFGMIENPHFKGGK
jgi:predicted enzyme related to lactoylglutathione lyase